MLAKPTLLLNFIHPKNQHKILFHFAYFFKHLGDGVVSTHIIGQNCKE